MLKFLKNIVEIFGVLLICSSLGTNFLAQESHCIPSTVHLQNSQRVLSTKYSLQPLQINVQTQTQVAQATSLKSKKKNIFDDLHTASEFEEGEHLMSVGRWEEAKKFFEKSLRLYPNNLFLYSRFTEARRRSEIGIRYQDSAFTILTQRSPLEDQRFIFDEVFTDIAKYHVDNPHCCDLFKMGIRGIFEALSEDSFYRQNKLSLSIKPQTIALFEMLYNKSTDWTLKSTDDVRDAVFWIAKQMQRYLGINESLIISEFLCSAVCSLDAYSKSLSPSQVEDVFSMIDGNFVGVGIELKTDTPTRVFRVIPNSPAEESGINVNDELLSIDGHSTQNLTSIEIGELLQGYEGDVVTLKLRSSNNHIRTIVTSRRQVEVPSIEDVHVLVPNQGIGYIKITCFQRTTAKELKKALSDLTSIGISSLIIDLRQNPGGLLQEAIDVSNIFLNSGTIVQTKGRNGSHVYTASDSQVYSLPLVLVIDSNSASAAEIFAGAIQENRRGIVVGTQSYGKGTVQAIIQLTSKTQENKPIAGLRLTTEKFYSPNGRAYGGMGVSPDISVISFIKPESQQYVTINPKYSEQTIVQPKEETIEKNSSNIESQERRFSASANEIDFDPFLLLAIQEAIRLSDSSSNRQ